MAVLYARSANVFIVAAVALLAAAVGVGDGGVRRGGGVAVERERRGDEVQGEEQHEAQDAVPRL